MANFKIDLLHPIQKKSLNECTWAEIKEICDLGLASDIWKVGDTKTVTWPQGSYTATLVDLQAGRYSYTKTGLPTHAVFQITNLDFNEQSSYIYTPNFSTTSATYDKGDYVFWDMASVNLNTYIKYNTNTYYITASNIDSAIIFTRVLNETDGFQCWTWRPTSIDVIRDMPTNAEQIWDTTWPTSKWGYLTWIELKSNWDNIPIFINFYRCKDENNNNTTTVVITKNQYYNPNWFYNTYGDNIIHYIKRQEFFNIYDQQGNIKYNANIATDQSGIYRFVSDKKSFLYIKQYQSDYTKNWCLRYQCTNGFDQSSTSRYQLFAKTIRNLPGYQRIPFYIWGIDLISNKTNNCFFLIDNKYLYRMYNTSMWLEEIQENNNILYWSPFTALSFDRPAQGHYGTFFKDQNYESIGNENDWINFFKTNLNITIDEQDNLINFIDYIDISILNKNRHGITKISKQLFLPAYGECQSIDPYIQSTLHQDVNETKSNYNNLNYGLYDYCQQGHLLLNSFTRTPHFNDISALFRTRDKIGYETSAGSNNIYPCFAI